MREFSLRVTEALQNGIKTSPRERLNRPFLHECVGLRPSAEGLVYADDLKRLEGFESLSAEGIICEWPDTQDMEWPDGSTMDWGGGVTVVSGWPFPQIQKSDTYDFLLYPEQISIIEKDLSSSRLVVDVGDPTEAITDAWHVASFGEDWISTNGIRTVYRQPASEGSYETIPLSVSTAAYLNGRYWLGGFKLRDFAEQFWPTTAALFDDDIPKDNGSIVLWSPVNQPASILFEDKTLDDWEKNELGYNFMPTPVSTIIPLGERLIIYGADSIHVAIPQDSGDMAFRQLLPIGVANRDAVAGNDEGHVFLGQDGKLYEIQKDFGVRGGFYEGYFDIVRDFHIFQDTENHRFYISDFRRTGIYERGKLGFSRRRYTSILSEYVGLWEDPTEDYIEVKLNPIDFGGRDLKTLTNITVAWSGDGEMTAFTDVRYGTAYDWEESPEMPVNEEGSVRIQVSGVEFRPGIRIRGSTNAEISQIELRWQNVGKRFVRGARTTPANL